jgi:histidine triad (HIT) family protein
MAQQLTEEQVKELQEKLKHMSPEELKEFQKKQCIFCQIVAGKVQSKKIYEDSETLAVLDVNPANPGHMLIMPKEHYSILPQIPEDEIGHIFTVTKALSNAALRSLEVQGSNIIVANGVAAGQRAQHFMVHLIPRKDKDNIQFEVPQTKNDETILKETSEVLLKAMGSKIQKSPTQKVFDAEFEDLKTKEDKKAGKTKKGKSQKSEKKIHNSSNAKLKDLPQGRQKKISPEKDELNEENSPSGKISNNDRSEDENLDENQDLDEIARVLGVK